MTSRARRSRAWSAIDGPLSAREAIGVGVDLCRALAALHAAGLLHRDIKAQNVMREVGGRIVLMDFSGAQSIQREPRAVVTSGTPLYMAPELLDHGAATFASDVYSLGVLLFFLFWQPAGRGQHGCGIEEGARRGPAPRLAIFDPTRPKLSSRSSNARLCRKPWSDIRPRVSSSMR